MFIIWWEEKPRFGFGLDYTLHWQKMLATPGKCHIERCFMLFQEKWDIFKYFPFCESTLLINILWGNAAPNNRTYSSGKGVVKIMQILHRDGQPGIVQSSNQIICRDRNNCHDLSAHKVSNLFYYIKVRGLGWPLNGGYVLLIQPCDSSTRRVEHCHVQTRIDDFCRQICFLQNQEGFLTMFWHNCPHSRFYWEWSDCQHRGSQWPPHNYRNDSIINYFDASSIQKNHNGCWLLQLYTMEDAKKVTLTMGLSPFSVTLKWNF